MRNRTYFSDLGRKGGRAGRGSPRKRLSAIAAAKARWSKSPGRPVDLTVCGHALRVSRQIPGLPAGIGCKVGRRKGQVIEYRADTLVTKDNGGYVVPGGIMERVKDFLAKKGIKTRVIWEDRLRIHSLTPDWDVALEDLNYRQRREMKRLIKQPFGALCRSNCPISVILRMLQAYPRVRALIVCEETQQLFDLEDVLRRHLKETIGVLARAATESQLSQERVTLLTAPYLRSGIIDADECDLLIFPRCPRTSYDRVYQAHVAFPSAWRLGFLGKEKRGRLRSLIAEAAFGSVVELNFAEPLGAKVKGLSISSRS